MSREMTPAVSPVVPPVERRWLRVGIYLLLVAVAAVLYLPHAGIPFFADDFEFRFADPQPYILGAFGYSDLRWFRPIKASWYALNQYLFGEDTFVLQAGQIAMHAALTCTLFWFLRSCGLPLGQSLLGTVWFLVNPINVSAILDVHFISSLPVSQPTVCRVWADRRPGQIVGAEGSTTLVRTVVVDGFD